MSVIKELYYGNIVPAEKFVKTGGEYQKINNRVVKNIEELMKKLNKNEKELLEEIDKDILNISDISQKESFIEGFCLGTRLIIEIMNFESSNFAKL